MLDRTALGQRCDTSENRGRTVDDRAVAPLPPLSLPSCTRYRLRSRERNPNTARTLHYPTTIARVCTEEVNVYRFLDAVIVLRTLMEVLKENLL